VRDVITTHMPETIIVKAPQGFNGLLKAAARRQLTNRSEYIRRALIVALQGDGIQPLPAADERAVA
jgi:hypothetical protein